MSFQLVYGDHEVVLALHFESHIEDELLHLIGEAASREEADGFRSALSGKIVDAITSALESRALPPTERQVKYAVAIARELLLELPPSVLKSREAMTAFLGEHAGTYRRRKSLHQ